MTPARRTRAILFTVPVVDPYDRGEAEGVYKEVEFSNDFQPHVPYAVLLGYLVQCWSRLNHLGPANRFPIDNVTGDYTFTADSVTRFTGKEWRVSAVAIEITDYPKTADYDFGDPGVIYAGKFSWLRNRAESDAHDWLQPTPPGGDIAIFNPMRGGLLNDLAPPSPNNTTGFRALSAELAYGAGFGWGNQITTGAQSNFLPGVVKEENSLNLTTKTVFTVEGTISFNFAQPRKSPKPQQPLVYEGAITQEQLFQYPLQWINFENSWFDSPHPNVNGFTIKLKPLVVARLNVILTVGDPYVIATQTGGA